MNNIIKNTLSVFSSNRWYRYFVYFALFCFAYFSLFAEHGQSVLGLISTHQYNLLWYYLGWFLGAVYLLSIIGLILFNKNVQYDAQQVIEIRDARKRFFSLLFSSLGKGVLWFVLIGISAMSTDSCGSNCFPFQSLISLSFALYPLIVGTTLVGALYCFLLRNIVLMDRLLKISNMWLWSLVPTIFVIFSMISLSF